jgi:hypothetical protein
MSAAMKGFGFISCHNLLAVAMKSIVEEGKKLKKLANIFTN